jgi:hypothetical protein
MSTALQTRSSLEMLFTATLFQVIKASDVSEPQAELKMLDFVKTVLESMENISKPTKTTTANLTSLKDALFPNGHKKYDNIEKGIPQFSNAVVNLIEKSSPFVSSTGDSTDDDIERSAIALRIIHDTGIHFSLFKDSQVFKKFPGKMTSAVIQLETNIGKPNPDLGKLLESAYALQDIYPYRDSTTLRLWDIMYLIEFILDKKDYTGDTSVVFFQSFWRTTPLIGSNVLLITGRLIPILNLR